MLAELSAPIPSVVFPRRRLSKDDFVGKREGCPVSTWDWRDPPQRCLMDGCTPHIRTSDLWHPPPQIRHSLLTWKDVTENPMEGRATDTQSLLLKTAEVTRNKKTERQPGRCLLCGGRRDSQNLTWEGNEERSCLRKPWTKPGRTYVGLSDAVACF